MPFKPKPPTPEEIAFREAHFEWMIDKIVTRELVAALRAHMGTERRPSEIRRSNRSRLRRLDAAIDDMLVHRRKGRELRDQGASVVVWTTPTVYAYNRARKYTTTLWRAKDAAEAGCEESAVWLQYRAADIEEVFYSSFDN